VSFLKMLGRLYWWRLRTQPIQEALAVAGIAAGVALIFAVEIANTSVPASVRDLVHGIAGKASLEVAARTPEGFNEGLVTKVGEAPGVFGDSGILSAHVTVIGPRGRLPLTLFGADPSLGAIGGPLPRQFSWRRLESAVPAPVQGLGLAKRLRAAHVDAIALPEGAAHALGASAGQLLAVEVGGRAVVVLCGDVASAQQFGAVAESPVAVALLPAVQRITGLEHRVSRILVLPHSTQQQLARSSLTRLVGGRLDVRSSDSEITLLEGATRSSNQVATLFTALSVVVGLLFAYNAMLLTLPARRRYVTRLRNMGAYRYELAALLALEILVLGIVASLVGLVLGDLLSGAVFGAVPRYLAAGFPIGTQRVITPAAVLIAIGGGMIATALATIGPAIGTLRGRPFEQVSETEQGYLPIGHLSAGVGIGVGLGAIIVTIVVTLLVPGGGLVAVGALAVGLGFILAPLVPWLVKRSNWLSVRLRSAAGYVATTELRAAPTRATAVAATSAIAVYAIVAIGGALNDIRRGVTKTTQDMFGSSTVVVAPSSFTEAAFPVQPFPPAPIVARLRAVDGVTQVGLFRSSFLDIGTHRLLLIVKPQKDPVPVAASQIIQGSASMLAHRLNEGGWLALSSTVAREWHLHLGTPVVLPTPSGYARFRLAATINNYGWPPGAVVMGPADYTRLWRTTGTTILSVRFRPSVTEAQGLRAVRGVLTGTGLTASTRQSAAVGIYSAANQGMSQLSQISTFLLAAAVLAVIAAMSGSIWQRRPRLATLKRLGMYRGELVETIYLETGVVVLIGCLIGAVFGLFGQPLATLYIRHNTGFPELFSPAAWLSVRTLVVATVLAMLATGLLGYLVTRRSVVWKVTA
jgi:putative ABC transport system permease protein